MKENNIIQVKSFEFALEIVKLYRYLVSEKKEYILSKQLMKSGTSIGANIEEAIGAHSKKDFLSKLTIAYKEARETLYWIRILIASNYLEEKKSKHLEKDVCEILKIIGSIQKTIRNQLNS